MPKKSRPEHSPPVEQGALTTPIRVEDQNDLMMTSSETITAESGAEESTSVEIGASVYSENLITDIGELERAIEALIFAAPKALSFVKLKNILSAKNYNTESLKDILNSLEQKFQNSGMQLIKVAGGYQFRSHPSTSDLMQKLLEDKPARLGQSALEVLAIVAYKQPVSRSEIDAVRGVDSGHLMKGLMEKNLVRTLGHAETPGRPLLYGTTPYFLEVFTLNSLDDLPNSQEFERELKPVNEDPNSSEDVSVLAPEPNYLEDIGLIGRPSPLAANPDRGTFDAPAEDQAEAPDFGIQERAREELEAQA